MASIERFAQFVQQEVGKYEITTLVRDVLAAMGKNLSAAGMSVTGDVALKTGTCGRGGFCMATQGIVDPDGAPFTLEATLYVLGPDGGTPGECCLQLQAQTQYGELLLFRNVAKSAIPPTALETLEPKWVLHFALKDSFGPESAKTIDVCGRFFGSELLEAMTP